MIYSNPMPETDSEHFDGITFDQIHILNETFSSSDAQEADALNVQVYLDKGASIELKQGKEGRLIIKVDQTPAGPMARVFVVEGSVSYNKVNVHIFLKDGSRLTQTIDV